MRTLTTLSIAAMLAAGSLTGAMAQSSSIYVYNFNDATATSTTPETAANTTALFTVDKNNSAFGGTSSLSTTFTPTDASGGTAAPSAVAVFGGTTVGADGLDPAGEALALVGMANNGNYLQLNADLTGYTGITVSLALQKTGTGFGNDTFQYSTDGLTFTDLVNYTPLASFAANGVTTFDLSGVAGLNNDPTAAFRFVLDGATSTSGNNRFDNLIVAGSPAAVPEASTTVSFGLLLALGLGGFVVARRRQVTAN